MSRVAQRVEGGGGVNLTTEEMLKPAAEEVELRPWWRRWLRLHAHCFHACANRGSAHCLYRKCCHCGRLEYSTLEKVATEHGTYAPEDVPLPMNWTAWRRYTPLYL